MRPWLALIVGLLCGLLTGCASEPIRTTSWLDRWRQTAFLAGDDVVVIDIALLERPIGDRYLNEELWTTADEQVVASERRAMIQDNGFRVAQIGGVAPSGLQALLTSDRSCANPRRIQVRSGNASSIVLGPMHSACEFQLHQEGRVTPVRLTNAHCTLAVTPTIDSKTKDQRIHLQFIPMVQHGDQGMTFKSAADFSGWLLQTQRPTEKYPEMSWEVTLRPNEYVVIGARYDRPETLGHQAFLRSDEAAPLQRLLILRASRTAAANESSGDFPPRSPPLAVQAGYSTARGSAD